MRSYTLTIPAAAGVNQPAAAKIDVDANFLFIVSDTDTSSTTLVIRAESVKNSDVESDYLVMAPGQRARFPAPLDSFTFYNYDNIPRTVVAIIGKGDYVTNQISGAVSITGGSVAVTNLSALAFSSGTDTVLGAATSADFSGAANNREVIIQAHPNNTGELIVRDQVATADAGIHLQPGERAVLTLSGGFRIRNNTAANQTYSASFMTV